MTHMVIGSPAPRTRDDCVDEPRPCPWASCRHHLLLEVAPRTGSIKTNPAASMSVGRPAWEWSERETTAALESLPSTCALDIAEEYPDGLSLEAIATLLGQTKERVRQVQDRALRKLATLAAEQGDGP